ADLLGEVLEQRTTDARSLLRRKDVGVADQVGVAHALDAHHAEQFAGALVAPEHHTRRDLRAELVRGHVRLVPAVGRGDAAVCLGCRVDDAQDRRAVLVAATADQWASQDSNLGPLPYQGRSDPPADTDEAQLLVWDADSED